MSETIKTDLCVIGAGSGGLSVAAGAVQMGATVVLIERGKMGGDCLNYGCVPSKSLLAAAKTAHSARKGRRFGVETGAPEVDFKAVHDHVHDVIAAIAPHDSQERFEGLGVRVIREEARFVNAREVAAGSIRVRARRFVLATGSRPFVPPIEGLDDVDYLTNETVFDLTERPEHLIIVGGGPIGMEMAQAHRRLGSAVTVLEMAKALPKDDPDLTAIVLERLRAEGVDIREDTQVQSVSGGNGRVTVRTERHGKSEDVAGSHILVATGRAPSLDGLNLDKAGVDHSKKGVETDARLRSSNKRIYAIGDCKGGLQFTHLAGYDAGIAIRNALFPILPGFLKKADYSAVPWVTYTDPELAHVGLNEQQARDAYGDKVETVSFDVEENDRARAERATVGRIKVVVKSGKPIGASIVAKDAGDLIQPWILAIAKKLKMSDIAGIIAPYPTLGEINKRVAGAYFTDRLFSDRTKRIVRLMQKLR